MKLLVLALVIFGTIVVQAQDQSRPSISDSNSIFQNLQAIPSVSLITAGLKNYHSDLLNKLNDTNGEKLTFFVPTDRAVASASKILNFLLQRSGYPSLDKLKEEAESRGNKCPAELSPEQCAPWNLNIGITNDEARKQAELYEKLPPGYNVTDIGMQFGSANAHYHTIGGSHSMSSFPAHCFFQTLAGPQFDKFVRLNGGAQVMHIQDIVKSGHINSNQTAPSDRLSERITPIKILYGVAYDPIPKETIDRLQRNASFTPGLVDNNIASVIIPDIQSANGMIHVIDKVLVLPLNATRVMHASNLTKFQELIIKAGLEDKLNKELQNITIFAPTNDALDKFMKEKGIHFSLDPTLFFPDMDFTSFADNAGDNTENLRNLVLHHVVEGSYYPPYVPSEAQLKALDGKPLQLSAVNPHSITVEGINAERYDILLKNGVMHVLSGVLPGAEFKGAAGGGGATSGCPQPGQPVIRPVPGAQVSNGTLVPGFAPPGGESPLPSATDLGCPESDAVCRVIDFDFLQCKTQYHTLSENERQKCERFKENLTLGNSTGYPNSTVCYNHSTHTCVHGIFLCPLSHPSVCGVQCYNEKEYRCWSTMSLCPVSAPEKCGEACYNRTQYSCQNGQLMQVASPNQGQQRFDIDAWKLKQEIPVHTFRSP